MLGVGGGVGEGVGEGREEKSPKYVKLCYLTGRQTSSSTTTTTIKKIIKNQTP